MARKVFVIQAPRDGHQFDIKAVERLGEMVMILPTAPNMHDESRMKADLAHMCKIVRDAHPSDVFVTLGGAPISLMLFGAACAIEKRTPLFGLFSRGRDNDGRRGGSGGSYRLLPVPFTAA
jgi:hypothetical protein